MTRVPCRRVRQYDETLDAALSCKRCHSLLFIGVDLKKRCHAGDFQRVLHFGLRVEQFYLVLQAGVTRVRQIMVERMPSRIHMHKIPQQRIDLDRSRGLCVRVVLTIVGRVHERPHC